MTPARQPQEYIITMSRIIKARNMLMVDGYHNADVLDRMVNLLRARPHTSPPAPEPDHKAPICENCGLDSTTCRMDMAGCLQAQNAAAKAERERVLKPLVVWLTKKRKYYGACSKGSFANDDPEDYDPYDTVLRKVESLRSQQEPQQEGR